MIKRFLYLAFFTLSITAVYPLQQQRQVMTVNGMIPVSAMGRTLVHEHIITNFNGTTGPNQKLNNEEEALEKVLPHLLELRSLGFSTLVECTPSHIGKNAGLLKQLSEASGLNIITNTGYYAAVDKKYLPESAFTLTAKQLAETWETEWLQGIGDTGIRPGFIKLGVGSGPLDEVEQTILKAGFLLSERSGLTVYVHTGGDQSIISQAVLADDMGFNPAKLVWVHAQNGSDSTRIAMARKGIWVSLDGVNEKGLGAYLDMVTAMKDAGVLHRLLLSHDDGWSLDKDDEELELTLFGNGNTSPYQTIARLLQPALYERGFTPEELVLLLETNPREVLSLSVSGPE